MPHTLLVVEDEDDIREMLRDYFELEGYRVVTAADGAQAMRLCAQKPDLILMAQLLLTVQPPSLMAELLF